MQWQSVSLSGKWLLKVHIHFRKKDDIFSAIQTKKMKGKSFCRIFLLPFFSNKNKAFFISTLENNNEQIVVKYKKTIEVFNLKTNIL